ncbi:LysM peptidoglycan-binding domain-containing protein [Botrimarina mediterranea]|uniref:LysM peptidoglycan-binding domain-containing protein n=1 Tax=Botrimarina mediterranea TaxID=2528022 RepID=UPI0011886AB1|nr:LysM domain/BON superfamily protein [Planctomycetes bacterium K2D]
MTELNKLLTSLILLGGGFFAASLVGPPEVIDRLSRYLQPSGFDESEGLRPLAANTSDRRNGIGGADPWSSPSASPTANSSQSTNEVASVAAMMPTGSWSDEAPMSNVAPESPWGPPSEASTGASRLDVEAPSQDWLTSQNFASTGLQEPHRGPSGRPLTPVPRGNATDDARPALGVEAPESAEREAPPSDGWPELRAPLPPVAQQGAQQGVQEGFEPNVPQEVTVAKPMLDASPYEAEFNEPNPYGARPRFDAASTGFDSDRNPLRYDASAGQSFDPIERQPAAASESFVQHIVTDGDTLASIADRYLGDSARSQELFELNRDRLQHPDVLPIGMVLKAPKDRPARAAAPAVSATGVGYPHLERPGDFSTVSASEAYLPPAATAQRRPLKPVGSAEDRPLTDEQRRGPVDALYQQEFAWDANGW